MTFRCWSEVGRARLAGSELERTEKLVELLKRAFGAAEKIRISTQEGSIAHCELQIGEVRIHIGQVGEGRARCQFSQLLAPDCEAALACAIEAGASEITPVADGLVDLHEVRVVDPFGNTWVIGALREDTSPHDLRAHG